MSNYSKSNIFFLRHFKTNNNLNGIISGQSLEEPIIESFNIKCDIAFDKIFCSTARRCRETISIFCSNNKVDINTIIFTNELQERNMGILENQSRSEMIEKFPHCFYNNKFSFIETPPNGESFNAFANRVHSFYKKSVCKSSGNILICSHNQTLKMLNFIITGTTINDINWYTLSFPNGIVKQIT